MYGLNTRTQKHLHRIIHFYITFTKILTLVNLWYANVRLHIRGVKNKVFQRFYARTKWIYWPEPYFIFYFRKYRRTYPCCFLHIWCVVSLDIMMRADNILQFVIDNHTWTLKMGLKFHFSSNSHDIFSLKLLVFESCSKSLQNIPRGIPKRSEKKLF